MTGRGDSRLRVVVTGLAMTYPYGGSFWDYVQYPLGFLRMGHEVLYLEDTGKWCYEPDSDTFVEDGSRNAERFARNLQRLDPDRRMRWFLRDALGQELGATGREAREFCAGADLFVHLSAGCLLREEYRVRGVTAFVDSDPLYTQSGMFGAGSLEGAERRVEWWREHHDVFFTFGENIGRPGCRVPPGPIDWLPTRQPVVIDCFLPHALPAGRRRRVFTTVASWKPHEAGPVVDGVRYGGKNQEFARFLDLPRHSAVPLELAMSGPAPRRQLEEHGWKVRPGIEVSRDPWTYRRYLADSLGEWSVAKNAYVASRSGWFSCRTACYLALGVPAVVQDTGFRDLLPTGEGLLAFGDLAEAAAAIDAVASDPQRHSAAAREIAREHFAHDRVLGRLVDRALGSGAREAAGAP